MSIKRAAVKLDIIQAISGQLEDVQSIEHHLGACGTSLHLETPESL
jgi:hypothetical protein